MNACEKYTEWMTDAALGALAPRREAELLVHFAECQSCSEAYQQASEVAAFVDRGVESLVTGEPSAHFASRLQARIAEEHPARVLSWPVWDLAIGGTVAAALLAVLIVSYGWRRGEPKHVDFRAHANTAQLAATVVAATAQGAGPVRKGGDKVVARDDGVARTASRSNHARRNSDTEAEVLVPTGQLDVILQFARAVRAGEIDGKQLLAAQEDGTKPLAIDPLGVAPLGPPQSDSAPEAPTNERP